MPRIAAILLSLVLLAGCGGPNLSAVDLEPLLIQAGDLPADVTGAQIRDQAPQMFDGVPAPTKQIYQQLARGSSQIGGVSVLLYAEADDRTAAYSFVAGGMGQSFPVDGIGEQAVMTPTMPLAGIDLQSSDLLFRRCGAIVHIRMMDPFNPLDNLKGYAGRLDKRLQAVVC